jgi:hypothetical protein
MTREAARRRLHFVLAAVAVGVTGLYLSIFIAAASYTLAFDYLAYDWAARRLLAGGIVYDPAFTSTGVFGLFYYPVTFLVLVIPFALLPPDVASALWIGGAAGCFALAMVLMPVRVEVRWITLALVGVSWPLIFAVKVGQVGPLLLLLFAIGWRWLDRPGVIGAIASIGALIKLQPALLFGWLLLERRWRDIVVGVAIGLAVTGLVTILLGPQIWFDFLRVFRGLDDPLGNTVNFAPGSIAYAAGLGRDAAGIVQLVATVLVVAFVVILQRRATSEASYLAAVVATQIASPILWDHYALMLALPVAWLLHRGQWWAALIPLSQSAPVFQSLPPVGWLLGYVAILAGLGWLGIREAATDRARLAAASLTAATP